MKGVNLINKEVQKSLNQIKLKKKVKRYSVGLVLFFIFVSVGVFLLFLLTKSNSNNNVRKINALKQEISSLQQKEAYLTILDDRIKGINTINSDRKAYSESIDDVLALNVAGFKMEGLEFTAKGDLKIAGVCDSRGSLDAFYNEVERISSQNRYKSIIYPTYGFTKDGLYAISIELKR